VSIHLTSPGKLHCLTVPMLNNPYKLRYVNVTLFRFSELSSHNLNSCSISTLLRKYKKILVLFFRMDFVSRYNEIQICDLKLHTDYSDFCLKSQYEIWTHYTFNSTKGFRTCCENLFTSTIQAAFTEDDILLIMDKWL
jgi:hypothetical protein